MNQQKRKECMQMYLCSSSALPRSIKSAANLWALNRVYTYTVYVRAGCINAYGIAISNIVTMIGCMLLGLHISLCYNTKLLSDVEAEECNCRICIVFVISGFIDATISFFSCNSSSLCSLCLSTVVVHS